MTFTPRNETVCAGTTKIVSINSKSKVQHEVFGPNDEYVCSVVTLEHARRVLFRMHQDGERGLAGQ